MEKSQERLQQLLRGYFDQTITVDENKELWAYVQDVSYQQDVVLLLPDLRDMDNAEDGLDENRQQSMLQYIFSQGAVTVGQAGRLRLWHGIAALAAAVSIMVFGVYFWNTNTDKAKQAQTSVYSKDIAPGGVGATLTLASGKTISLRDAGKGELANEAGVSIRKSVDGELVYELKGRSGGPDQINTLSTANGETYTLTLPDKSKVWMNAASSLTYSAALSKAGQRRVELNGEAYFEVSKDRFHPFVVESRGQEIEVLGTHFNVNAYANEPSIKTTLLEGRVRVARSAAGGGRAEKAVVLKPGQQSEFSAKGIHVSQTDAEMAIAWKNNEFNFESVDIHTVMRMVERWYNVQVVYDAELTDEKFSGGVSRFDRVSKVLKSLESTGKVHFRIEGRRIFVSR